MHIHTVVPYCTVTFVPLFVTCCGLCIILRSIDICKIASLRKMSGTSGGFAESDDPVGSISNMSVASLSRVLPRGEVGDVKHRGRNLATGSNA